MITDVRTDIDDAPAAPPVSRRDRWLPWLPPLLLAAAVFAVHDVGYVLRAPYWLDEAWVAVSTRFDVSQLRETTSSTPIGWSFLIRLIVFGGPQRQRVVPLLFAALAVVAAYWLARRLDWPDRSLGLGAGVLAGIAALFAPSMLQRNDLKQYTADACVGLAVLVMTAELERSWSRRRLAGLAATVVGGMLVSHPAAFVGGAALLAVALVQLARRAWRRLAEAVGTGLAAAAGMGLVYHLFDARAVTPSLTDYWRRYYAPFDRGLGPTWHFVYLKVLGARNAFGLGPAWLAVPLLVAGLVTLVVLARPAVAAAVLILIPELVILSGTKAYPLLDRRTSTFFFVIVDVVAAIGVAGVAALVVRWGARIGWSGWLRRAGCVAVAGAATAMFLSGAWHRVRIHSIPQEENVGAQIAQVERDRVPGDVVIVTLGANLGGYAYYCKCGTPTWQSFPTAGNGFLAVFPGRPDVLAARSRTGRNISAIVAKAVTMTRARNGRHVWVVGEHRSVAEARGYGNALRRAGATVVDAADGLTVATF